MVLVKMKPYLVSTLGVIFLLHLLGSLKSAHGATKKRYLTKEEHMKISKFLRDEIKKKFNSSDSEDDGELLTQESQASSTLYKLVKEQECADDKVIFRSPGKKEIGKEVVVLMRGQDYFNPMNKERFVVLRQKGGGSEYTTHLATVKRDSKNKMSVSWDTVLISITPDASPLIELSSKPILVVGNWGTRKVPKCAWASDVLICEARDKPRRIGDKRPQKPKRRRPKPPYGKLPTPMPPFPPPPKKEGRPKIKNPYGLGEEGGPPLDNRGSKLPGLDKPLIDPIPGMGPGQGKGAGQGQNKSNKPGAGGKKGSKTSSEETFIHKDGGLHKEKKGK